MEFNLGTQLILIVVGSFKNIFSSTRWSLWWRGRVRLRRERNKRDSMDKLVTRQSRLADPNHGTAIKSFRKSEDQKSKLPYKFWDKS